MLIIDGYGTDLECSVSGIIVLDETFDLIVRGSGLQDYERAHNDPVSIDKSAYLYEIATRHEAQNVLSGYAGIDEGRRRYRHCLAQHHEARPIRSHRLNDPLDGIFIEKGVGCALRRLVSSGSVGHRSVDENHHASFEVALVAGLPIHRHHCGTGVVVGA